MKKRKYRKNIAILIFIILIISITTGYALLDKNVKITGKVNLKVGGDNNLDKYIITYSIENRWTSNGLFYYNIKINFCTKNNN